jgi:homoserine dehydrogenase
MTKHLNIALIGPGLVGKEFLSQISKFHSSKLQFNIVAVMSSSRMKMAAGGLDNWDLKTGETKAASLTEFLAFSKTCLPCVLVDCTSNDDVANIYPEALESLHVITPNKKGFSGSLDLWDKIKIAQESCGTRALHESTVGAGLPIISTLTDLVETGDEIVRIEGIFSGTLSYIFNLFSTLDSNAKIQSFSSIVKQAKELGYTEPDPRDDLNGMDVARKVIILARVAGSRPSLETLAVQNIVPEVLRDVISLKIISRFLMRKLFLLS